MWKPRNILQTARDLLLGRLYSRVVRSRVANGLLTNAAQPAVTKRHREGACTPEIPANRELQRTRHYGPSRRAENKGFYLIMANFGWERLIMALGAVASISAVLERVGESAAGKPRWRHAVAEVAIKLEASRCLTYPRAGALHGRTRRHTRGHGGKAAVPAFGLRGGRRRLSHPRRRPGDGPSAARHPPRGPSVAAPTR